MRPGLLLGLVACTGSAEPTDTADTADTADTDTDTGTAPAWIAQAACGSIRVFATSGVRGLVFELRGDVPRAVRDQTVLELSGTPVGEVRDGMTEGDACGSVEGFPESGPGATWDIRGGTVRLVFTPAAGLDPDESWMYDGTEVGTLHVEIRDLVLEPVDDAGDATVPDLDFDLPLVHPDLPA